MTESAAFCDDCGCLVAERLLRVHDRFHSILASHAWGLAILKTSHIAAHVHDEYTVVERIDSRKFDNWSGDALAEVMLQMDQSVAPEDERVSVTPKPAIFLCLSDGDVVVPGGKVTVLSRGRIAYPIGEVRRINSRTVTVRVYNDDRTWWEGLFAPSRLRKASG